MKNQNISDFVAATMNAVLNSDEHQSLFGGTYKTAAKKCAKCAKDEDDCMCGDSAMLDDSMNMPEQSISAAPPKNLSDKPPLQQYQLDLLRDYAIKYNAYPKALFMNRQDRDRGPQVEELLNAVRAHLLKKKWQQMLKTNPSAVRPTQITDDEMYIMLNQDKRAGRVAEQKLVESVSEGIPDAKAALDVAVDSLLTASAALDSLNMDYGSALSLKLASLVSQAKKKMSPAEKKELLERLQKGKKDSGKDSSSSKSSASGKSVKDSQSAKDKKMSGSSASKPSTSKSSVSAPKKK